jgi:hypothetical protein
MILRDDDSTLVNRLGLLSAPLAGGRETGARSGAEASAVTTAFRRAHEVGCSRTGPARALSAPMSPSTRDGHRGRPDGTVPVGVPLSVAEMVSFRVGPRHRVTRDRAICRRKSRNSERSDLGLCPLTQEAAGSSPVDPANYPILPRRVTGLGRSRCQHVATTGEDSRCLEQSNSAVNRRRAEVHVSLCRD